MLSLHFYDKTPFLICRHVSHQNTVLHLKKNFAFFQSIIKKSFFSNFGEYEFDNELAKWAVSNRSNELLEKGLRGNPIIARATAIQIADSEDFKLSDSLLDALVTVLIYAESDETKIAAAKAIRKGKKLDCMKKDDLEKILGNG